jgi:hypothetical protein
MTMNDQSPLLSLHDLAYSFTTIAMSNLAVFIGTHICIFI